MKQSFPMLVVPVGLYNLLAIVTWMAPGLFGSAGDATGRTLFSIPMLSHGVLAITLGDIILIIGLIALFAELVSSTSSSNQALIGDALTLVVFVVCLVEFLLLAPFATPTFLLLLVMVLMDTLAGFIVSTVSARKDIAVGG